eukprot:4944057-Pleurochrysis_carterae.AAC.4
MLPGPTIGVGAYDTSENQELFNRNHFIIHVLLLYLRKTVFMLAPMLTIAFALSAPAQPQRGGSIAIGC